MKTYVKSDKPLAVLDVECYRNYFLLKVRRLSDGKTVNLEQYEGVSFDIARARQILNFHETVSFNGRNYDLCMAFLAMKGLSCAALKDWSDRIILGNMRPWEVEREANFRIPYSLRHIDLIEVAPGQASLKIYGGRLHSRKMQDLPIEPDATIQPHERPLLSNYCGNDLDTTEDLLAKLTEQLELRRMLGKRYNLDLMSKSDAQIAEAVIKSRLTELTGNVPEKPAFRPGSTFRYIPPKSLKFTTKPLQDLLAMIAATEFRVGKSGSVEMPASLEDFAVEIGKGIYRMGIGGLHSSEESTTHHADDDTLIIDRDVASYYPRIILNNGYFPEHLGRDFLTVFNTIVEERLAAKANGDKVTAESLKITINGTFGKLGSRWSIFYSPNLLIHVTISGQLFLLMLIAAIEAAGIRVVSANTDGIVIKCPKSRYDELNAIVAQWEKVTGFETEETRYKMLASRDVNNYIAVYATPVKNKDGSLTYFKGKGAFANPGLQKNPTTTVCVDAVANYLVHKTPIEATVRTCKDVRKFVAIRQVRGGGVYAGTVVKKEAPNGDGQYRGRGPLNMWWEPKMVFERIDGGEYLGKAVRFYYSTESEGPIRYKSDGNTVPKSEGCMPMMELTERIPADLDYGWYIRESSDILQDLGLPRDTSKWHDHLI